jgi:two-component system phosphate regulon sensor histidine kinase PhoR
MAVLGVLVALIAAVPLGVVAWIHGPDRFVVEAATTWAVVVAGIGGVYIFSVVDGAFHRIKRLARAIRAGNLEARIYQTRSPQLTRLYAEVNQMAGAIEERIAKLSSVSAEQRAILRTMIEGVLVIDRQGVVRTINRAALNFLDVTDPRAEGRKYTELFQHLELERFVARALMLQICGPLTISVGSRVERVLEIQAAPLQATEGVEPGVLFVMYDITRIQRLESVRKDFVANVSHELRTPITSIKGFVETLLEGAKDDAEACERFLTIIARQADRLNSIFNDLLTLSRLEAGGDSVGIEMEERRLGDLVQGAVEDCIHRAREKGMAIEVSGDGECSVRAHATLLHQALVNLIDNAIKYSEGDRPVRVELRKGQDSVEVAVIDQGPGIERRHLERLFERFYRVDHGRSRQLGGTGLGLSIVKHIVNVHGGKVAVESTVGRGSTFSVVLPLLMR